MTHLSADIGWCWGLFMSSCICIKIWTKARPAFQMWGIYQPIWLISILVWIGLIYVLIFIASCRHSSCGSKKWSQISHTGFWNFSALLSDACRVLALVVNCLMISVKKPLASHFFYPILCCNCFISICLLPKSMSLPWNMILNEGTAFSSSTTLSVMCCI